MTTTYDSVVEPRGPVGFPEFVGDRLYMLPFTKAQGLPEDVRRWQSTVDAMLDGIDTDGPLYLMVDESAVQAGCIQRRPGVHIDGYWHPGVSAHGHVATPLLGHGTVPPAPSHRWTPSHRNAPSHRSLPPSRPTPAHRSGAQAWSEAEFKQPEGILLASNISAACGYVGSFEGPIQDGGDCAHIDLSGMQRVEFPDHQVIAGNVTALHESLPVPFACQRQLVRINVPGWSP